MYRTVVKRLLLHHSHRNNLHRRVVLPPITTISSRFTTHSNPSQSFSHQKNPTSSSSQIPQPETQSYAAETLASATATAEAAAAAAEEVNRYEKQSSRGERQHRVEYQDEQARVLQAALRHVLRLGWSEASIISGAKEVGVSPSIVGSFPRKEAALVEFFMDDCLQRLIDRIESGEDLKNLIHSDRIAKLIQIRLEMQAPYISKWAQALSIQAEPMNIPTSFKQRAVLIDEIWHAAGDQASDIDWYVKRTVLGGIYSAAEVYMLSDNSPDFRDTWTFVRHRVKDAFDLEKTVQEAKYLAEAVGAGIGSTLQGFMKGMSQGR
ncbi:COQ9 [Macleaya cordata]|uniref:Ubiquinone biosynthesis protein n=1 Tax=Macleaya cordata TaxID=56857 RepID=A0A200Q1A7_MACCD|nr:COQ9 [Macleaya cordata]